MQEKMTYTRGGKTYEARKSGEKGPCDGCAHHLANGNGCFEAPLCLAPEGVDRNRIVWVEVLP